MILGVTGVVLLAACSGGNGGGGGQPSSGTRYPGGFGSIPAEYGTPTAGDTITYAEPPGAVPTWILPIVPSGDNSVYTSLSFLDEMWRPLYWPVDGVEPTEIPAMNLASTPVWSDGDKTVAITVESGYRWSDGTPLTAKDVLFTIDEIKAALTESPANWAAYSPGFIPDDIASASTPDASTLVLNLKSAVNPTWYWQDELGSLTPMPAQAWAKASANGPILDFTSPANATKIYNFLDAQAKDVSSYATNPLWQTVDGPYRLTQFNNTTGAFTMTPNADYGGPHAAHVSIYQAVPFTSDTAEFDAIEAGAIDVGYIPLDDVPDVRSVQSNGYDVFGYPVFGFKYVAYNFKDKTGDFDSVISQLYFRQAMAHLEDEQGYIDAFFHGAGGQAYGPIPAIPESPFTPSDATVNPYPFSVSDAVSLLKEHGWKVVPGGADTCQRPGTGPADCGAGIPAGTALAFPLVYATDPPIIGEQVTDLVSKAREAGISITLESSNFDYMIQNYNDPAAPANDSRWAMEDFGGIAFATSPYPTTDTIFNGTGATNLGGYSNPEASALINASITSPDPDAVKNEAAYLTLQQPVLFQPDVDQVVAWKKTISGPPAAFANMTQNWTSPEFWYIAR
jgi:peptide/nickel transport system substrate-binding protein